MAARYRGRIAPSPTGLLHLGHAATFLCASRRCVSEGGVLVYREEDLDGPRCRAEYSTAAREDLRWLGIRWQEGPDVGGDAGPYVQSERLAIYRERLRNLIDAGLAYPCACTRGDIARALGAPHEGEEEPVYPRTCRSRRGERFEGDLIFRQNWRFRVPDGRTVSFEDGFCGPKEALAGRDFGDFLIWRKDGFPAYQLAVVTDDALMRITEVVRGEDLVTSTFRQILLYEVFGEDAPAFAHAPLVRDEQGKRLAKRDDARSIRALREAGMSADAVIALALAGH
jgi:glutamyl/glutaminyl-tRNA synthetase